MNRDNENNINSQLDNVKIQNDLLRLIQVLGDCIDNMDNFYCYTMKKQFLSMSNNN